MSAPEVTGWCDQIDIGPVRCRAIAIQPGTEGLQGIINIDGTSCLCVARENGSSGLPNRTGAHFHAQAGDAAGFIELEVQIQR